MSDPADQGGDPACWAHLQGDPVEPPTTETLARLTYDMAEALIICDADGRITFWNQAATGLFGWTSSEVFGGSLDIIVPELFRKRHWDGYHRVMRAGVTSYGDRLLEVPALHRDGRTISIAFTVSLLRVEGSDRLAGIAALVRDDTERRRELQRLRSRGGNLN